jgi:DNA-directed RNA polymerase specialized sigma24 family protein
MNVLDPHVAAGHRARLNRLAFSLCGSPQLADDLTQETYLRVLSRQRRLRGHGGEFPYLARTLRNVLNDHRRSQKRQPALVIDDQIAEAPQTRSDGDPLEAARAGEVYAAIALPETFSPFRRGRLGLRRS